MPLFYFDDGNTTFNKSMKDVGITLYSLCKPYFASRKLGFPVLYGDGSRPAVLQSAGISSPKAVMVMYTGRKRTMEAVQRIRNAFPAVPIYVRAQDLTHLLDLKKAGATEVILENAETSLQLGSKLLKGFGVMSDDVTFLSQIVRDSMEIQAQETLDKTDDPELDVLKPLQATVADIIQAQPPEEMLSIANQTDTTHNMQYQGSVDRSEHDGELQQSKDLDGNGVLYCELNTENSSVGTEDAEGEKKSIVDPSIPCITSTEFP
ncbi:K(+) efflux antiporter 3, chloroplastic [Vitis vinifera]|uniref:K(+) efflux antiporter 3, chloroplastic n=1 Tax=Vitis vinifera TaxID=29760 RepID=A0A438JMR5_VITVI|nr:K(+) efflux antiporter 3, chloroplastic [Vitis vinifera]